MPEGAGPGVVHFFNFDTLWATSGTGNIILFLFFFLSYVLPVVGGPRLYGASQVRSGLFLHRSQ